MYHQGFVGPVRVDAHTAMVEDSIGHLRPLPQHVAITLKLAWVGSLAGVGVGSVGRLGIPLPRTSSSSQRIPPSQASPKLRSQNVWGGCSEGVWRYCSPEMRLGGLAQGHTTLMPRSCFLQVRGPHPHNDALRDLGSQRVVLVLGVCLQCHHQHKVPGGAQGYQRHRGPAPTAPFPEPQSAAYPHSHKSYPPLQHLQKWAPNTGRTHTGKVSTRGQE